MKSTNPRPVSHSPHTSSVRQTGLGGVGLMQIAAGGVLIAAMFSAGRRAALPAFTAVLKFLWPFVLIWLIWRLIKRQAGSAMERFKEQMMQAVQQQQTPGGRGESPLGKEGSKDQVIDLCPKCGVLLTAAHRC